MNKSVLFAAAVCAALSGSCKAKAETAGDAKLDSDSSYAMGMYLAYFIGQSFPETTYDYKALVDGFRAMNEAGDTKFPLEDAMEKLNAAFEAASARQKEAAQAQSAENKEKGQAFLDENGAKPGVVTTESGLQYEVITQGTGAKPAASDTVEVNYEGALLDGTVFDSSYERGQPASFPLSGVIRGWTEGLQLMSVGSTYRFFIPSDLAYGDQGNQSIPPGSTLIFKVELLSIVK